MKTETVIQRHEEPFLREIETLERDQACLKHEIILTQQYLDGLVQALMDRFDAIDTR